MEFPGARLLIFAKAPEPGAVKTRLVPALGEQGAARMAALLARHCVQRLCSAALATVELWCSPSKMHPFFAECETQFQVALYAQPGGDLGERMSQAVRQALERGGPVVLVGTDCPSMEISDLRDAFRRLYAGANVVIGPAEDGGYYLLGLDRYAPELLTGIPWGQRDVLAVTRRRAKTLGLSYAETAIRWDVDRPADVQRLATLHNLHFQVDQFTAYDR